MTMLGTLQSMYGAGDAFETAEERRKRLQSMMDTNAPQTQPWDGQTFDPPVAEQSDMAQPQGGSQLGNPDVMAFTKQLIESKAGGAGSATGGYKPPKGLATAGVTVEGEAGGPSAAERASYTANEGQAQLDEGEILRQRKNAEADELERRAAYLRQDAQVEHEKRQQQEAEIAQKQERLRAQQEDLASQNDEPINPNRYIEDMSLLGKASALASAAIYGYLGGRGQPPVVETLMQLAKEDTAAQIENRRANQGRRSALIEQYEREYGDTTLVAKRLEADKLLTMAKEADAQKMDVKTAEQRAAAEDIAKQLKVQVGRLHNEIQKATWEKPVQVKTTFAQPKPVGAGAFGNIKKGLELDKMYEERGLPADAPERVAARRMAGVTESVRGDSKPVTEQGQQVKKDVDSRRHTYALEDRELADEEQAMVNAMEKLGGSYDPDTGKLSVPKDMKGAGIGAAARSIPFTEASYAEEALTNLADVKQRQRSGAAAPVAEAEKLRAIASGKQAYDETSVGNALSAMAQSLYARRKASMVGAGEDVLQSYDSEAKKLPKAAEVAPVDDRERIRQELERRRRLGR